MKTVTLNRTSRINSGHLWVFSNELTESPKAFEPGSLVELRDKKGAFLGIGYINPHSLISVRILTREQEEINEGFFKKRILAAIEYRKRFKSDTNAYRAVYSESDLLPGLIVDMYAGCASIQISTLGMEQWTDVIIKAVDEILAPETIVLRNDSQIRTLEGLAMEKRLVKGTLEKLPVIKHGATLMEIDPMAGQKTGFFLDQADNRSAFAALVNQGKALDLFCYAGGWALKMAERGATVTGVDSSEHAVAQAAKNAATNGLTERCAFVKEDVFEFLKKAVAAGDQYDYIVLDPPAFVKSKQKLAEALRAYKDVNTAAMKILKKGGLIATSTCSYHVDLATFMDILRDAARNAGRHARLVEMRSQSKDHPVSLSVPETYYLKCAILELD